MARFVEEPGYFECTLRGEVGVRRRDTWTWFHEGEVYDEWLPRGPGMVNVAVVLRDMWRDLV